MDVDILQFINQEDIIFNLKAKNKKNAVSLMLDHLIATKKINKDNKKEILKTIMQREQIGSTAIGGAVAFPHARIDCVKSVVLCLAHSREGLDFESLDGEPVHVVVLLLSHQKESGLHLKTLAFLAKMLRDKLFVQQLINVSNSEEIMELITRQSKILR